MNARPAEGLVTAVWPFGREGRRVAVQAVWPTSCWSPATNTLVRQFRDGTPLGWWRIVGVDLAARQDADAVLILEPDGPVSPPQRGDVFAWL